MVNGSPTQSASPSRTMASRRVSAEQAKGDPSEELIPNSKSSKRARPRDSCLTRQVSHDGLAVASGKENADKKVAAAESVTASPVRGGADASQTEPASESLTTQVSDESMSDVAMQSASIPHLPNPLHNRGISAQHEQALRLEAELHPMRLILSRLMAHLTFNRKGLFNSPVDPVALGLPDYFKVVKHPMDLGTVKNRLHAVEYESAAEVVRDVRLCLQNAMLYNPPQNTVHSSAKDLLEFFRDQLESFYPQLASPDVVVKPPVICAPLSVASSGGAKLKHAPLFVDPIDPLAVTTLPSDPCSGSLCLETGVSADAAGLSSAFCSSLAHTLSTRKNSPEEHLAPALNTMGARKRKKRGTKANLGHNCQWCLGNTCTVCQQGCLALEPTLLICNGVHCAGAKVRKGAVYYVAPDGSCQYCQRCHASLTAVLPHTGKFEDENVCRYKRDLLKRKNDEEVVEGWINCSQCDSAVHQMCAMYNPYVHRKSEFVCGSCVPSDSEPSSPSSSALHYQEIGVDDRYTFVAGSENPVPVGNVSTGDFDVGKDVLSAEVLSETPVSKFIQAKVRERMIDSDCPNAEKTVTVRVISDSHKFFKVPDAVRKHFQMIGQDESIITPPTKVHYQSKAIALFQKIDGLDVCIFCMYVQEYDGSDDEFDSEADKLSSKQEKRIYIAYLDSVDHFRPRKLRTYIYQEVMTAYLASARIRGFESAHIWACPPSRGNSFVFWNHPTAQRTPNMERLTAWYHAALSRAISCGVVTDVRSLYETDFKESLQTIQSKSSTQSSRAYNVACPPLLDGDFWIEEAIRVHGITISQHVKEQSMPVKEASAENTEELSDPCPAVQIAAMLREKIIAHPSALAFRRPVNAAALKLKDYHAIVTKPMDLATVHSRCVLGEYGTLSDFVTDMDLVFNNAKKFNPPGHVVHLKALEIAELFAKVLNETTQTWLATPTRVDKQHSWKVFANMSMCLGHTLQHFDSLALVEGLPDVENAQSSLNTTNVLTVDDRSSVSETCVSELDDVTLPPLESGPYAVLQRMVGGDVWLLDKHPVPPKGLSPSKISKRKKLSSDSIGEPAPKRLRQSWLGEEVGKAVRRMRTSFFKCSLRPEFTKENRNSAFAQYTKQYDDNKEELKLSSRVADARHGLLEFSQFRNLEFDTLRRAKYSSQILLYHMHHDTAPGLIPSCTSCCQDIEGVRWHRIGKVIERRPAGALVCGRKPKADPPIFVPGELCAPCYGNTTVALKNQFIPLQASF